MSNCCKSACWTRFLPHNWLCLKGLYVIFVVLFYLAVILGVYMAVQFIGHPMLSGRDLWINLAIVEAQILGFALFLLTFAKILKALAKIKHAVAPCCQDEKSATKASKKEEK